MTTKGNPTGESKAVKVTFPNGRVEVFGSMRQASKELQIDYKTVYNNLKNVTKSRYGYLFEYLDRGGNA